jgi:hypothetical protein
MVCDVSFTVKAKPMCLVTVDQWYATVTLYLRHQVILIHGLQLEERLQQRYWFNSRHIPCTITDANSLVTTASVTITQ